MRSARRLRDSTGLLLDRVDDGVRGSSGFAEQMIDCAAYGPDRDVARSEDAGVDGATPPELPRDDPPGAIHVAPVEIEAVGARRLAGHDERADSRREVAGHHAEMRDVSSEPRPDECRLVDVMGDGDAEHWEGPECHCLDVDSGRCETRRDE
jgi:hypothetical protein